MRATDPEDREEHPAQHALVELNRVAKHYRSAAEDVRAVDGIDLRINAGEMVALQGPSGSGKTTLLLLTAGLLRPDTGTVRYAGRDLAGLRDAQLADHLLAHVGFIYQRFHLMPRVPAVDNAAQGLLNAGMGLRAARRAAITWLERVGLADRLEHTPEALSSGERQRVAVARVLARDPSLILADEPTGNLDSTRSRELVQLLRSIAHDRNAAVLLATHDPEAAQLTDRLLRLRDGLLSEQPLAGQASATEVRSSAPAGQQ